MPLVGLRMKLSDIIDIIESVAPPAAAASWDASGVQVAGFRQTVSKVAVMLDPALPGLRQAVDAGADFVLAHHPLSMKPRYPNRQDAYLSILSLLLRHDVWLYSAHTSLDGNPGGPVRWLGDELALEGMRLLEPDPASAGMYGFGFAGTLPQPLPYGGFCTLLARALGREEWQACGPAPATVRRVACCPGSGGSMLDAALREGADVFITGDVKYHAALDAQTCGMRVLDVGHFILEEAMMRRFAGQLEQQLAVPVIFVPSTDPLAAERLHP